MVNKSRKIKLELVLIIILLSGLLIALGGFLDKALSADSIYYSVIRRLSVGSQVTWVDGNNRSYMFPSVNNMQVFDENDDYLFTFGGVGTPDQQIVSVESVVTNDTHIYIMDSSDGYIKKYDLDGNFVARNSSTLMVVTDMAFDSSGNLYALDSDVDRMYIFDSNLSQLSFWVAPSESSDFEFTPDGSLIIFSDYDNCRLTVYNPSGVFQYYVGRDYANPEMNCPSSVSTLFTDYMLISDQLVDEIQAYQFDDWSLVSTMDMESVNSDSIRGPIRSNINGRLYFPTVSETLELDILRVQYIEGDDLLPPEIVLEELPTEETEDRNVLVTGTTTDQYSTIQRVQYSVGVDSLDWYDCSASDGDFDEAIEAFSCNINPELIKIGENIIYIQSFDDKNNYTIQDEYYVTARIMGIPPSIELDVSPGAVFTVKRPLLSGTSTENVSTVTMVEYQVDYHTEEWKQCSAKDGRFDSSVEEFACYISPAITNSNHRIYFRATDRAGNVQTESNYEYVEITVNGHDELLPRYLVNSIPEHDSNEYADFNNVSDYVEDSEGNYYIANRAKWELRKYSSTDELIYSKTGTLFGENYFSNPYYLALDSEENLYVYNNYIYNGFGLGEVSIFDKNGRFLSTWSNNRQMCANDMIYANGKILIANNCLSRIDVYSKEGVYERSMGSYGVGDGNFLAISRLAVDSDWNIYVTDNYKLSVQVFTFSGSYIRKFGSSGSSLWQFGNWSSLNGITLDASNNVYVIDTAKNRIAQFDTAGNYNSQILYNYGLGPNEVSSGIYSLTLSRTGDFVIAESGLSFIALSGEIVKKFSSFAYTDYGLFNNVNAISVNGATQEIYILDPTNSVIRIYTKDMILLDEVNLFGLSYWTSILVDEDGYIYATGYESSQLIQKYSSEGVLIATFEDVGLCPSDTMIEFDQEGDIWISDPECSGRIFQFNQQGEYLSYLMSEYEFEGSYPWVTSFKVLSDNSLLVRQENDLYRIGEDNKVVSTYNILSVLGEHASVMSFETDFEDNIYLYDNTSKTMSVFDLNFNYLGMISDDPDFYSTIRYASLVDTDLERNMYIFDTMTNRLTKWTPNVRIYLVETNGSTVVEENGDDDSFEISLFGRPDKNVVINISTENQLATLSTSTLTFTPQNWFTPQTVTLTPKNNDVYHGDRSAYVEFSVYSQDQIFNKYPITDLRFTIKDDEPEPPVENSYEINTKGETVYRYVYTKVFSDSATSASTTATTTQDTTDNIPDALPSKIGEVLIKDENGIVVVGASVVLKIIESGTEMAKLDTDVNGIVKFYDINPSRYTLEVRYGNRFQSGEVDFSKLGELDIVRIEFSLIKESENTNILPILLVLSVIPIGVFFSWRRIPKWYVE